MVFVELVVSHTATMCISSDVLVYLAVVLNECTSEES